LQENIETPWHVIGKLERAGVSTLIELLRAKILPLGEANHCCHEQLQTKVAEHLT
jgi:hypothetical protein